MGMNQVIEKQNRTREDQNLGRNTLLSCVFQQSHVFMGNLGAMAATQENQQLTSVLAGGVFGQARARGF